MGLRINRMDGFDMLNNPGDGKPAFTIWFQGCSAQCPGCHNPELWDPMEFRMSYSVKTVLRHIDNSEMDYNSVVLLGGEPMEQHDIIQLIRALSVDYKVWLYTGWEIDQIPQDVLDNIYFLKTGKYIDELATGRFPASSNQKTYRRVNQLREVVTI